MRKISVITVVYNDCVGLEKTIQSVMSQTYNSIEYIVVDGGSTDGTVDIIKKYESFIGKWISEKDNGIYDAMNKGIQMSTGDWLNFLNASDYFISNTIVEDIAKHLDSSSIVYGNMIRTDGKRRYLTKGAHGNTLDAVDFMHSSISHQAAFIRKEVFQKYGFYSTNYRLASDAEFFYRVLVENKESFKYIDKPFVIFALGGASSKQQQLYNQERKDFLLKSLSESVYERYEELYWLRYCKTAVWLAKLKRMLRNFKHKYLK